MSVLSHASVAVAVPNQVAMADAWFTDWSQVNVNGVGGVITGASSSSTVTVFVPMAKHPEEFVKFSVNKKGELQVEPAMTVADCEVVEPLIVPLPEIVQE